jgi:hypothetical protein
MLHPERECGVLHSIGMRETKESKMMSKIGGNRKPEVVVRTLSVN